MTAQAPDYSVPDYLKQLRLDGKNFVVLGAGQGIGEATTHGDCGRRRSQVSDP
jgi:hypothetical protein